MEESVLLKTKYTIPPTNKHLLYRRELARKLEQALYHKLTLISAPAGYGKTSVVLKWLESTKVPSAWVTADEGDNDALSFWRYVIAALDNISTGIGKKAESVFASEELFNSNQHINILVDCLWSTGSDFVLALDNLHLISNPSIYESLSRFINYLPSNIHLVLISRAEPPIKFAKLDLKDELIRIQAKQLRFTKEEISQYFQEKGYYLKEGELNAIESYTEGWAAALVAVAHSLEGYSSINHTIGRRAVCNSQIEQYFSEDIYHMWTAQQQDFMEKTSVLDKLCAPLCEAVTGCEGNALLQELQDQNAFLTVLDKDGIWFQYHHLFSDFLKKRLKRSDKSSIADLYQKAGVWLESNGNHEEAIEYFLKGGFYDFAVQLIELYGGIQLRNGNYLIVNSWLDRLPIEYTEQNFRLLAFKGFCLAVRNNFASAGQYIQRLSQRLKNGESVSKDVYIAYLFAKANLNFLQGDMKGSMSTISELASYGITNVMHTNYLDLNLYDISMYRAVYFPIMIFLQKNSTDFASCSYNYRKLISSYPGYAPLIKGEFFYESGNPSQAMPLLASAAEKAIHAGCPGALVPAMVTIAKIKHASGDLSSTLETIRECGKIVASCQPHWCYMLNAFKARLYIDVNNTEQVNRWMAESKLSIYHELSRECEFELIVYARALIKKHRYQHADILLNRLLVFAEGLRRNHSIVEILNLLAITAMKNLNEEDAFVYISRALNIGMQEGYVKSFVDELSPMLSLLKLFNRKSSKRNKLTEYVKKLIDQTQEAIKNFLYPSDFGTIEKILTRAEKKVLQLIIKGYTNKEIANELFITVRTVSAHATNIYKKLGVKNRTQCVQKATGASFVQ